MKFAVLLQGISHALRGGMQAPDLAAEVARGAARAAMRSPSVRGAVAGAALGDSLNAARQQFTGGDLPGALRSVADGFTVAAKITETP